ncbi:hypothetical protein PPHE_a2101 [Pseudoalteromonas phenolica O-BC30]|nr:hypothetical protein [Pseudoalteromonas phenolica O-BC30]
MDLPTLGRPTRAITGSIDYLINKQQKASQCEALKKCMNKLTVMGF